MNQTLILIDDKLQAKICRDRWVVVRRGSAAPSVAAEELLYFAVADQTGVADPIKRSAISLMQSWVGSTWDGKPLEVIRQPAGCLTCAGKGREKLLAFTKFLSLCGLWIESEKSVGRLDAWFPQAFGAMAETGVYLRGAVKLIKAAE